MTETADETENTPARSAATPDDGAGKSAATDPRGTMATTQAATQPRRMNGLKAMAKPPVISR